MLKQTPHAWHSPIDGYLMSLGFKKRNVDSNLYFKVVDGDPLMVLSYVDDFRMTMAEVLIFQCKRELVSEF